MTLKFPSPVIALLVISAFILFAAPDTSAAAAAKSKKAPAKAAAKPAAKKGGREAASARKAPAGRKETRASRRESARDSRRERAAKNERRNVREERSARSRRGGREEQRASKNERAKDSRKMSRRERMAEARREAERRRREAAERARQIAIARAAYLARIRAQDQAYKDETAANIARDETTGEDLEVRRAAVNALGDKAGTVVVMDPKSGRVYTVVNQGWALRRGFKPCSTIKLVTGLAGLNESVIDPVQTVNIGTGSFSLDLTTSLAVSNNGYFQRVGGQVGFEKMMEYARKMGLGQPTGINHPFESPGRLPVFKEGFALNRMSSHGDDIEVTAVQLANMAAAIANGGKLLVPHLPRTPEENVRFKREVKREIEIPQEHVNRVVPGMIGAVTYGTARRASAPTLTVAGKTGSCIEQSPQRPWVGLFTSYAPVHDPQLAVAVILRSSGARGKWAAAVAGDIYRNLAHRFGPRPGTTPMLANEMLAPRPKIDLNKAAEFSDEEKDEEAAEGAQDAYVVSEAGEGDSAGTNAAPTLKRTVKSAPRAVPPANTSAPSAAPSSSPQQNTTVPAGRPRRVTPQ